jgi:hypothetical protein
VISGGAAPCDGSHEPLVLFLPPLVASDFLRHSFKGLSPSLCLSLRLFFTFSFGAARRSCLGVFCVPAAAKVLCDGSCVLCSHGGSRSKVRSNLGARSSLGSFSHRGFSH